ncbi:MAG: class I SAM-dependent methyltransferase [Opitutales bacterium]|nr:class I SAM-dependent methyltransferase [Opitutales bacterium]
MKTVSKNRFLEMAQCYHETAPFTVPQYDWLQDQALDLIASDSRTEHAYFVDVGGGSGRMVKKYLKRFPDSKACIVDSSDAFLELAAQFLSKEKARVDFIQSPIEENWENELIEQPTTVFSMSCIHHLLPEEKQTVYQKCGDILMDGGLFMNVDEMIRTTEESFFTHLQFWWEHGLAQKDVIPDHLRDSYERFMEFFYRWKVRNIDQRDQPKQKGDDLYQTVTEQLEMLKNVDLKRVDSYFSFRVWNAIAGRKSI